MKITKLKLYIIGAVFLLLLVLVILNAEIVSLSVKQSVENCMTIIIPSLFALMFISGFILSSGIGVFVLKPLYFISRFWFKGDNYLFTAFSLSLIGGYPVGIKLLSDLSTYNKNYSAIGSKYLSFCYCPSPTFVIGVAGLGLFSSYDAGMLIYVSNVLACITVAIAVNLFMKRKESHSVNRKTNISLKTATSTINSTVKALSIICASIILFNIIISLLNNVLTRNWIVDLFNAAFEISNIAMLKSDYSLLPLYSALFSTGGLCIMFQTCALATKSISLKYFFIARIPTAALSAVYCYIINGFFDVSVTASLSVSTKISFAADPFCSFCLIMMSYILVNLQKENSKNSSN